MTRPPIILALASAAALMGCKWDPIDFNREIQEVTGTPIAPVSPASAIAWSPSGEDLAFVSADGRTAYRYQLSSGLQQPLYQALGGELIADVALSGPGDGFVVTLLSSTQRRIWHHAGTQTILLTDSAGPLPSADGGRVLLVAPSAPVAAFIVNPDSLFLLATGGNPGFLGVGCLGVVALAADASRVLCRSRDAGGSRVFPTDGGAAQPVELPGWLPPSRRAIRWGTTGIEVLYWEGDHFAIYRAGGPSGPLPPVVTDFAFGSGWSLSWSGDGLKAAYWTTGCAGLAIIGCGHPEASLYTLDVATGAISRVALHRLNAQTASYRVSASPTGAAIAYVVNGQLYLLDAR